MAAADDGARVKRSRPEDMPTSASLNDLLTTAAHAVLALPIWRASIDENADYDRLSRCCEKLSRMQKSQLKTLLHADATDNAALVAAVIGASKSDSFFSSDAAKPFFPVAAVGEQPEWAQSIATTAEDSFPTVTTCGKCCTSDQVRRAYDLVRQAEAATTIYVNATEDPLSEEAMTDLLYRAAQLKSSLFARCVQHELDADLHAASATHVTACKPVQKVAAGGAAADLRSDEEDKMVDYLKEFCRITERCESTFDTINTLHSTHDIQHQATLAEVGAVKRELREEMQRLNTRMAGIEVTLAEICRNTSGQPPASAAPSKPPATATSAGAGAVAGGGKAGTK